MVTIRIKMMKGTLIMMTILNKKRFWETTMIFMDLKMKVWMIKNTMKVRAVTILMRSKPQNKFKAGAVEDLPNTMIL